MKKTTHLSLILFLSVMIFSSPAYSFNLPLPDFLPAMADTLPDAGFGEPMEVSRESGQEANPFAPKAEEASKVIPIESLTVDSTYIKLNEIPKSYSGFKIEIFKSTEPLPADHDIFFQHGNVSVEEVRKNEYSYTLGDFDEQEDASIFMQDFLLQRYPDARVIEYEEGKRLF
jgi:hypothetical protein